MFISTALIGSTMLRSTSSSTSTLSTTTNSATFHSEPWTRSEKSVFWAVGPPTQSVAPTGPSMSRSRSTSATVCVALRPRRAA